jgi:hypothetical protein
MGKRLMRQLLKSNGLSIKLRSEYPVKHLGFPESSLEAEKNFRQKRGQILSLDLPSFGTILSEKV